MAPAPYTEVYTFMCEWLNYMSQLTNEKFAVVASGPTYEMAVDTAAQAILSHFPNISEYATPRNIWDSENGVARVCEFYGDVTVSLVDDHAYEVIHA
ncbi:hypothetical protein [Streptomyces sp. NPDC017941]|uniref:hypothetical protein n=1 Tax=unclassified Streptomyces TaxID=2593676 RepID=UPI0037B77153